MAIAEWASTLRLRGFRVSGHPPKARRLDPPVCDEFELEHVALEHARRLHGQGWRGVSLEKMLSHYGDEWTETIKWDEGLSP